MLNGVLIGSENLAAQLSTSFTKARKVNLVQIVVLNNFANHMFKLACNILVEGSFSYNLLKPISIGNHKRTKMMSPFDA